MRHAVADLARRVEISRAANERYLEALAIVDVPCPAHALLDAVSRPVIKEDRPYRALRPVSPEEAAVFEAVLQGRFHLKGFTNCHLRNVLAPRPICDPQERRRASGRITRLLRRLRAHRLICRVSGTRYYRVTHLPENEESLPHLISWLLALLVEVFLKDRGLHFEVVDPVFEEEDLPGFEIDVPGGQAFEVSLAYTSRESGGQQHGSDEQGNSGIEDIEVFCHARSSKTSQNGATEADSRGSTALDGAKCQPGASGT
jgi:hypothetical protein